MKPNFNAIKAHYELWGADILSAEKRQFGIDPYAWSSIVSLSPIEDRLWQDIRDIGMVLYPQYPVGRYFVDFGNPKSKVAIECDGKEFHKDKKADQQRQDEIEALGWVVYRFTGKQCHELQPDASDEFTGQAYRCLQAIGYMHGISPRNQSYDECASAFHSALRLRYVR